MPQKIINLGALTAAQGFTIQGAAVGAYAGVSVSSAHDINGDGIDDVVVGAPGNDTFGGGEGAAYVIFGTDGGLHANIDLGSLDSTQGFTIQGAALQDNAGYSVASAGDINGDGVDDLIVGAIGVDGGAHKGAAYIIYGSTTATHADIDLGALTADQGFVITGAATSDTAGFSVSSAGDLNGDGIDDLVVGAPFHDASGQHDAGAAYVIYGTSGATRPDIDLGALTADAGFVVTGGGIDNWAGWSVSSAGDINGDGIDDLIVGAPLNSTSGKYHAGAAYVIYGTSGATHPDIDLAALPADQGFVINGAAGSNYAGLSVSSAGDLNGDGIDDLIVGAQGNQAAGAATGSVYVIYGTAGTPHADIDLAALSADQGFALRGVYPDAVGARVSSAGDVNGDGINDIIIGAPGHYVGAAPAGGAYVVYGTVGATHADIDLGSLTASQGFIINVDYTVGAGRATVSAAGDVNGDGYDDVIVGAKHYDGSAFDSGAAYVVYGFASTTFTTITGTIQNDSLTGTSGADHINGLTGTDTLTGNGGDDTFIIDTGSFDHITDLGGGDTVTVAANSLLIATLARDWTATAATTNDGTANIYTSGFDVNLSAVTGGSHGFWLTNLGPTATLTGSMLEDTLIGYGEGDTMLGGAGDDSYIVQTSSQVVIEAVGEGTDYVSSWVSFTLGDNVENLGLAGSAALNGTGNGLDNHLYGNDGDNVLNGLGGNDTLLGGDGNDTLIGGDGNDTFTIDSGSDTITDLSGGDAFSVAGGATLDATLASDWTATAATTNDGSATLTTAGFDVDLSAVTGGSNGFSISNLSGTAATLTGSKFADTIAGGSGNDTMLGGAGDDSYTVQSANQVVIEAANEGNDSVLSSVTYTLGDNVENLTLHSGNAAINGTGNVLDNLLNGNSGSNVLDGHAGNDWLSGFDGADTLWGGTGNDTLDGGAGNDSMTGGTGDDRYVVDSAGDVVIENSAGGTDLVQSAVTYTLGSNVENLTLTGSSGINGTGNGLDNLLTGNSAANTLSGLEGNDTLYGGDGNDSLSGGGWQ